MADPKAKDAPVAPKGNFITAVIDDDNASGKHKGRVMTRFPPEPNGYLHIGHAKSICLNFGIAQQYAAKGAICNLRFDDTNPLAEDIEFINAIQADVKWLGFDWGENLFFASDYYEKLYLLAEELIQKGKAYVCALTADEVRAYRGTLTQPGKDSPHRNRPAAESLDLFRRMRKGEFPDGAMTLRAKIDMGSPNINMRDPALYRIRHEEHPKTGRTWVIYPMYDYAHGLSDAFEGVTHSICTLEFEAHRPLYDWILDELPNHEFFKSRPRQIEFARLNLNYTVTSKRKLKQLVEENHVSGWDDPRMPTLAGIRRRGYPAAALRDFCERIGVARADSIVDIGMLEFCVRDDLDRNAPRAMGVLHPIKVVIESYEAGLVEEIQTPRHQGKPELGNRTLFMTREIWLDAEDFMEDPPKDYHRLAPGREVRLRNSYIIKCEKVIKDSSGKVVELRCSHDPSTLGKAPADGRKVKGIVHWVSATHCETAEIRLYDRLFTAANPNDVGDGEEFTKHMNPASVAVVQGFVEKSLKTSEAPQTFQFERLGYFTVDSRDSRPGNLVFNRTVGLRDGFKP